MKKFNQYFNSYFIDSPYGYYRFAIMMLSIFLLIAAVSMYYENNITNYLIESSKNRTITNQESIIENQKAIIANNEEMIKRYEAIIANDKEIIDLYEMRIDNYQVYVAGVKKLFTK